MNQPLRKSYSREELINSSKEYMKGLYGKPMELTEEARDKWMERYGLLIDFISEHFPAEFPPDLPP